MSEEEKIQMVGQLISDMSVSQEDIRSYLALAADRILKRVWPFGKSPQALPAQYDMVQIQLAVRMIARKGGEGRLATPKTAYPAHTPPRTTRTFCARLPHMRGWWGCDEPCSKHLSRVVSGV